MNTLYETDFYAWTLEQAQFLESGQWDQLDREHLAEEIASLGKQQRQELRNRLALVIAHLLKWQLQPQLRSKSWVATLRIQRREIQDLLEENPSLKPYLTEALSRAFEQGVDLVVQETPFDYDDLPTTLPYRLEQLLDEGYFPDCQA
ncbi:MAG: DUF29 domain-containing protein [Thermostichus sp. BF3_bins_97]